MLIQLAIMGLLAALLPLAMVWTSGDADKYRKLVWVTLFLTFDLIMFGAFTRLTDSGPRLPRLARLLRPRQPAAGARAYQRRRSAVAERPGDGGEGLDRNDPPLPGDGASAC